METRKIPARKDGRVIIHFDYDCFYASVFEAKNPALKSLPFAVQQKQIIVTCNYEARRRGLHKLQLIRDAKRICPDVIIELGEDISQFRDASKELYHFIRSFSWSGQVERLGFDEIWMDVTDIIDYNIETINHHNLQHSFFQTRRDNPLEGFNFDASILAGHAYPRVPIAHSDQSDAIAELALRLTLGSHLALHIRQLLEEHKGYTSTVGIATNKLLSKLVGNLNKPKGQTTLMPPLEACEMGEGNAILFMNDHEIGKVPGIGFKLAQKLREFVLQRPAAFDAGLVYGGTKELVRVFDVRNHPDIEPRELETLLGGPGSPHGIGYKVWCLLHGVDDSEVGQARAVPRQISIEDSYIRLDTMPEVLRELTALSRSLLTRMRIDLLGDDDEIENLRDKSPAVPIGDSVNLSEKRWLAHPKTLRLSTRPRPPLNPDGTRTRTFKRISHSAPLPNFVFSLADSIDALAEKLVRTALLAMFRKLHPEKAGWNLSLVNVAVTNMAETAGESKTANGRNIGTMFRRQEDYLRDFRVIEDDAVPIIHQESREGKVHVDVNAETEGSSGNDENWNDDDEKTDAMNDPCSTCGLRVPSFAMLAHQRYHLPGLA